MLTLLFLAWHPGVLGSETLTLTTYYPAPYGGYVSLLTTGNTYLARDAGGVAIGTRTMGGEKLNVFGSMKWGTTTNKGMLTADQGSSIELGGNGTPYIDFASGTEDYSARLIMLQSPSRLSVQPIDTVNGGLDVQGKIFSVCTTRKFELNSRMYCPPDYRVVSYMGDGQERMSYFFLTSGTGGPGSPGIKMSFGGDWVGTMLCCKFDLPAPYPL